MPRQGTLQSDRSDRSDGSGQKNYFHLLSIVMCDFALLPAAYALVEPESGSSIPEGLFVALVCVGVIPLVAANFMWMLLSVWPGERTLIASGRSRWAWARVVLLPFALLPHAVPGLSTLGLAVMALLSMLCLADAIGSTKIAKRENKA
jgi:hypothetical protein